LGFGGLDCQFVMPILITSGKNGKFYIMTEMRKITALVPASLLEAAQACTGEGVTETLRQALQALANKQFGRRLLELRGKVILDLDLEELRREREIDGQGKVS